MKIKPRREKKDFVCLGGCWVEGEGSDGEGKKKPVRMIFWPDDSNNFYSERFKSALMNAVGKKLVIKTRHRSLSLSLLTSATI